MWKAVVTAIAGLWIMISPSFMDIARQTANNNYITGPLIITFSVIALWEVNNKMIMANILVGIWLLVALFVLEVGDTAVFLSNGAAALLIIYLSSTQRKTKQKFGGGWRSLFQSQPVHLVEAEKISLDRDTIARSENNQ